MKTRTCKTCELAVIGPFCPNCGQKHREGRITVRFIGIELFHLLTNLERGLWHTILGLLRNPGQVIRDFIGGATALYYQPFRFLLLMAGISALISSMVDYEKIMEQAMNMGGVQLTPEVRALQAKMMHNMLQYTNLIISLSVPLMSIGSYLLFRKFRNTYAEHLVANAYLYGLLSLLSLITSWFTTFPSMFMAITVLTNLAMIIGNIWFFKSWFNIKWGQAIWRSLLALTFNFILIVVFANGI